MELQNAGSADTTGVIGENYQRNYADAFLNSLDNVGNVDAHKTHTMRVVKLFLIQFTVNMPKKTRMTAKKRKLIEQIPAIISGKKTKQQALLDAGYSPSAAHQQQIAMDRIKTPMQEALEKANVTIDRIAGKIDEGMEATERGVIPDFGTRHKYVVTAAELHDVFPSKKLDHLSGGKPIKGIAIQYE